MIKSLNGRTHLWRSCPVEQEGNWRLDMHVHSHYSGDSIILPEQILDAWRRTGILSLVTDHDTLQGSRRMAEGLRPLLPGWPSLLAMEITTKEGEITGLFLNEEVSPGLSAVETVDQIHGQGGLVLVPHPFDHYRSRVLRRSALEDLVDRIDILEGYNGRNFFPADNDEAVRFAWANGIPVSAGSDAHTGYELSRTCVELPPFDSPSGLLRALRDGTVTFHPTTPTIHLITKLVKRAGNGRPG
jgi:predicted metal-dependent phosphoesterase TrpH